MFGFNPTILIASAVGLTASFGLGWMMASDHKNSGLAKNMVEALTREREVGIRREVNLWTQIGDERRARIELVETVQRIDTLSAEARTKMLAALQREKDSAELAQAEAAKNIEELRNAAGTIVEQWKSGVIPPDITCGVFDGKNCPEPAYPATGPDRSNDLEVRDAAPIADDDS